MSKQRRFAIELVEIVKAYTKKRLEVVRGLLSFPKPCRYRYVQICIGDFVFLAYVSWNDRKKERKKERKNENEKKL